jgi:hypothetical protein
MHFISNIMILILLSSCGQNDQISTLEDEGTVATNTESYGAVLKCEDHDSLEISTKTRDGEIQFKNIPRSTLTKKCVLRLFASFQMAKIPDMDLKWLAKDTNGDSIENLIFRSKNFTMTNYLKHDLSFYKTYKYENSIPATTTNQNPEATPVASNTPVCLSQKVQSTVRNACLALNQDKSQQPNPYWSCWDEVVAAQGLKCVY